MNVKKKLMTMALCLMMAGTVVTAAEAAEYSDVQPDDWHYQAITQMTEDGYLSGYGDGTFRPDQQVSAIETMVILEQAFGDPANIPPVSEWDTYPWHKLDWVPVDMFMGDYHGLVSRKTACKLLLRAAEIPTLQPSLYEGEYQTEDGVILADEIFSCLKYGYINGYGNGEYGQNDLLTRAQLCQILYNALYVNPQPEIPEPVYDPGIVVEMPYTEGYETISAEQVLYSSLQYVPQYVLDDFTEAGFTVVYAPSNWYEQAWSEYLNTSYIHSVGVFSQAKKHIIFNELFPATVIHEFGHFVDYRYGSNSTIQQLMSEELHGVVLAAGRDYAETNQNEFFADAYRTYIMKPGKLQEYAPKTFAYIDSLMQQAAAEAAA